MTDMKKVITSVAVFLLMTAAVATKGFSENRIHELRAAFAGGETVSSVFPEKETASVSDGIPQTGDRDYTLTYEVDGKPYGEEEILTVGSVIIPREKPVKEGYTFSGWYAVPATMPEKDYVIEGSFSLNRVTVTFDTFGGTKVAAITADYGTEISEPSAPSKPGFSFIGWEIDGNEAVFPFTLTEETVITAHWKAKEYTLSYYIDGSLFAEESYNSGDTVAPAEAPVKEGFTFSGWQNLPEKMPGGNLRVEGSYSANRYTVTFDTDGGSAIAPVTLDFGAEIETPEAPVKEGYTFCGWDRTIPETMPAGNIKVTALWVINQYTITFDSAGGTKISPVTADYGTVIEAPKRTVRLGFIFAGWQIDGKEVQWPYTVREDVTMTAQWNRPKFSLNTGEMKIIPNFVLLLFRFRK